MGYNRINLDGMSRTEAGILAAETAPGIVVYYDSGNDNYPVSDGTQSQLYVVNENSESVNLEDAVPTDQTANLEIVTPGRHLYCVVATGQTVAKDTPLKVSTGGLQVANPATETVFAVATEAVTTTTATGYVAVRTK